MKRPWIITFWAVFIGLAALYDVAMAIWAYGLRGQDYFLLNPGLLAFFRPIALIGFPLVPIGLLLMRRWGVVLYISLQVLGVVVTYVAQPFWLENYPGWVLPVGLMFPVVFAVTVLPYWGEMDAKAP